jgi:hypothetical protein
LETTQKYAAEALNKANSGISTVSESLKKVETEKLQKQAMEKLHSLKLEVGPKVIAAYESASKLAEEQSAIWLPVLYKYAELVGDTLLSQRKMLHGLAQDTLKPHLDEHKLELNLALLVDVVCGSLAALMFWSMRSTLLKITEMVVWIVFSPLRLVLWFVRGLLFYTFCCCCFQSRKAAQKKAARKAKEEGKPPKRVFLQYENKKTEFQIKPKTTKDDIKARVNCKKNIRVLVNGKVMMFNKIPGGGERVGPRNYAEISEKKQVIWTIQKV